MLPRDAFLADTEFVKFQRVEGPHLRGNDLAVSAGHPGHRAGRGDYGGDSIDYLRLEIKAGVRIQGPYDDELKVDPRRQGVSRVGRQERKRTRSQNG